MSGGAMRAAPLGGDTMLVLEEGTATLTVEPATDDASPIATPERHTPLTPDAALSRLRLEEDASITSYKLGDALGKGAYGEVFKALVSRRFMAVKRISLGLDFQEAGAESELKSLELEITTLKRLKHPRIVRYLGCVIERASDPAVLIFLEFMPGGSIKAVLDKFGPYGSGLVKKYTRQILEGLEFLHSERIVHRDVKGANVLVNEQGDAKIADFGACHELAALQATVTGLVSDIHGSVYWMAPEVMKQKAGRRSDIWSLGCTVIEMITAESPWANLRAEKLSLTETLKRILDGVGPPPFPDKISTDCRTFLEAALTRDPAKRVYAPALLKHRFIRHGSSAAAPVADAWRSEPTVDESP